jgi:hypothetical protein
MDASSVSLRDYRAAEDDVAIEALQHHSSMEHALTKLFGRCEVLVGVGTPTSPCTPALLICSQVLTGG